ncbi:putative tail tubular protein [Bacteriophage sp.]|nr:putative tail tubular protein [Bacteriophage sp.]
MQTLKECVQAVCRGLGVPVPTYVAGNPDPRIAQMFEGMNYLIDDLAIRKAWQSMRAEATFTTVATESQGTLASITGDGGFQGLDPDTMYNRTRRLPIPGQISAQEWQYRKAMNMAGPLYQHRIMNDELYMSPTPPAGETVAFEYFTKFGVISDTGVKKQYWTADEDEPRFESALCKAWLSWWYKKQKGLEYAEDFAAYERQLASLSAKVDSSKTVTLDQSSREIKPGIIVQPGSWGLS